MRRANNTSSSSDDGENEPLLAPPAQSQDVDTTWQPGHFRIFLTLLAMATCINLALQVLLPAQARVFESIFCEDWYRDHDRSGIRRPDGSIDERHCKIPGVQKQLSSLRGWQEWWDALPALFLALPFGILADKAGRKWLLRLCITVGLLRWLWIVFVSATHLPVRAVYLASVLNLFCGGNMIGEMMFVVILTDVSPRKKLANVFFITTAAGQACKVLGPSIAGGLMRLNAWYAIVFGLPLLAIASLLTFLVPETRNPAEDHRGSRSGEEEADDDDDDNNNNPQFSEPQKPTNPIKAMLRTYMQALREVISIWNNWRLVFLAFLVPFRVMTNALEELMQRYVSYRYGWALGDTAFLHSLQAVVAGAILLVLLPWISSALDRRGFGAVRKNATIAAASLGLLALGFAVQGLAPTVAVLVVGLMVETLGSGLPASIRALAGSLSGNADHSRVFGGLTFSETGSIMIVYPLSAALFNAGSDLGGGIWLGLPFYSTAAAAAVVAFIMSFLRFELKED